jgi:hypothetical protein
MFPVAGPNSSIVLVAAAEPHERQSGDAEGLPLLLPQVGNKALVLPLLPPQVSRQAAGHTPSCSVCQRRPCCRHWLRPSALSVKTNYLRLCAWWLAGSRGCQHVPE